MAKKDYGSRTYSEKRQADDSKVFSRSTGDKSRHDKLEGLSTGKHGHKWVTTDHKSRGGKEGGR